MTNEVKNVPELRFPEFEDEWKLAHLNDLGDFTSGGTPLKTKKSYWNGDIPWLTTGDINGKKIHKASNYITQKGLENSSAKLIYKEAILIAMYGQGKTRGMSSILNFEAATNQACAIFQTNNDIKFMHQFFRKDYNKLRSLSNDGSQKNLSLTLLKNHQISVPKLEEQQKIGDFFSKLDRQIELEEQKLEKLEQQKKGYMQKIFSQELRFKDENGNDYPDWEENTIEDVYKITRGYVLSRNLMSETQDILNKYPVYSSQTSNNGLMGFYSNYLYQDAITWTTDGANAGSVSFRIGKFYCTNVCGVLLNEEGNSNKCMAEMLNNVAFKHVSKVGNPKLMNNVMAKIKLKFPCLEEQYKISNFLNICNVCINNQYRKIELLKERKKGFLQKMFV